MQKIQNFIGGKYVDSVSGDWIDNICPATGAVFSKIANSNAADVDAAVTAALKAFAGWSSTPEEVRSKLLMKVADFLERDLEMFAAAESEDQGKTVTRARTVDIPRAIQNFRYYGGYILHQEEMSTVLEGPKVINFAVRRPVGVVGLISPWNLPLYLATWKIAPAIAFGNTCVIKPSELSPVTAWMLGRVLNEAGIPPGVVNIIHGVGSRCGQALVEHKSVPLISFTGGTVTGKRIAASTAPMLKRLSLELGGKNANIIFADCDFESCIAATINSSFANQGEICLCGSRIIVERSLYEKFVKRFVEETKKLSAGDPNDPKTFVGALISKDHLEKVKGYVRLAVEEGGIVLCGGDVPQLNERCKNGFFMNPTVITGLGPMARCNQEEIFGPAVTVIPFDNEEEALRIANGTAYGLSTSLWTRDATRANRFSLKLETGYLWINCWLIRDLRLPFGGVKSSGIGREGGKFAMDFYTEIKTVCSKY